jgi:hypothetical protein
MKRSLSLAMLFVAVGLFALPWLATAQTKPAPAATPTAPQAVPPPEQVPAVPVVQTSASGSTPSEVVTSTDISGNLYLTMLVVPLLQLLKKSKNPLFTWINSNSAIWISAIVAFWGAIGIHFAYNPSDHSMLVTGLNWTGVLTGAVDWARQFISQHWGYKFYMTFDASTATAKAVGATV